MWARREASPSAVFPEELKSDDTHLAIAVVLESIGWPAVECTLRRKRLLLLGRLAQIEFRAVLVLVFEPIVVCVCGKVCYIPWRDMEGPATIGRAS
jgi:hypothetical protein